VKLAAATGSLVGFQFTLQGFCLGYILAATYLMLRFAFAVARGFSVARPYSLVDGNMAASIASRREETTQPIPLAGFFMLGMAGVFWLGPLW
jgi:hypothetical protein